MKNLIPIITILFGAVPFCRGWEMPYAGLNMNGFKKSNIPDPVDTAQTVGNPLPSAFFEEQITGGRHPSDDKRYTIEQLNHAARHRNVYFDTVGGDPYGHSSPVLTRSHISVAGHRKKRLTPDAARSSSSVLSRSQIALLSLKNKRSTQHAEIPSGPQAAPAGYFDKLINGRHPDDDKRYTIAQLNQAARHRNVYYDTIGGDPYGSSSTVLTRSHIALPGHKKKRSIKQHQKTLKEKLQLN
ncbi:uncharacterized protein [Montipora capricornis]|uniref:uncharacterized protein n=1 Tax=Montipora capricornis TaxID=246305 RepID=UPI0035F20F14